MAGIGQLLRKTSPIAERCSNLALFSPRLSGSLSQCPQCLTTSSLNNPTQWQSKPHHIRYYSSQKRSFVGEFWDNLKQEFSKNKEMKDSLKKFRDEAEKLEQSDALKKAREKYESIESETSKGSEVFKQKFSVIQDKMKQTLEEAEKSEYAKKGKEIVDDISKTAEKVAVQGRQLKESQVFKGVSEGVRSVKEEVDQVTLSRARMYRAPKKLRKRDEFQLKKDDSKPLEADTDTTGMVMHKDSVWFQSWQNFKDTNPVVTKMFDMKMKYDESDNVVVRATRAFTDKMGDIFGGMFSKTELSDVVTEIAKMDPTFDKENFLIECQSDIIPNILEAMVHGKLDILEDWCYEAVFNTITHPIKAALEAGYKLEARVLDINHLDIVAGKMMEQGPVLVLSFNAQQIMAVRDSKGKVIEGDPDKIMKVFHVWAFCRDQTIVDPKAAWRLIDMSSSPAEQWL